MRHRVEGVWLRRAAGSVAVGMVVLVVGASAPLAATITVTTTAEDLTPNDGSVSLREALTAINAGNDLGDPDIIAQNPGTFGVTDTINLAAVSYGLTAVDNTSVSDGPNGLPVIMRSITINGNGATIQRTGAPAFRIFQVGAGGALMLNAVTLSGGSAPGAFGAGGGILLTGNTNALTLTDSTITGNAAAVFGGGIAVRGMSETVTLTRTMVSNNAAVAGGGIEVQAGLVTLTLDHTAVTGNMAHADAQTVDGGGISISGGPLTIMLTDSVVDGNIASTGTASDAEGGGISSSAQATYLIVNSTISNNQATAAAGVGAGGGFIDNGGAVVMLTNSTISGNSASGMIASLGGGGIESDSSSMFALNNVTIANNQASRGGGIDVSAGSVALVNTILAGNGGPAGSPDCAGPLTSHGYNLFGTTTGCTVTLAPGDITNPTPDLGPLASNGGPTKTQALLPGSPAIDAGNPVPPGSGGDACAATDQRGIVRPQPAGGRCDIGAFEAAATVTTTSTTTTTIPQGCLGVPTFADIDCRLDLLIAKVSAAGDLGRLKPMLLEQLNRAKTHKERAEQLAGQRRRRPAKAALVHAIQDMTAFRFRVGSLSGRRIIPAATRTALIAMAEAIRHDMQALRGTL